VDFQFGTLAIDLGTETAAWSDVIEAEARLALVCVEVGPDSPCGLSVRLGFHSISSCVPCRRKRRIEPFVKHIYVCALTDDL
jgi:hypothetical protein